MSGKSSSGTDPEHAYMVRAGGRYVLTETYGLAFEYATGRRIDENYETDDIRGEERISILHTRGREYVLDLSTDDDVIENQEACLNRRYNCGHVAYGPTRRLPSECPECNPVATDGGRSPAQVSNLVESLRITTEACEEYDVCPECGEEYIGLDTTMAGSLVFIHQESPLKTCTVDADTDPSEGGQADV